MIVFAIAPYIQETANRTTVAHKPPSFLDRNAFILTELCYKAVHTPIKRGFLESLGSEKLYEFLVPPIITTVGQLHYNSCSYFLDVLEHLLTTLPKLPKECSMSLYFVSGVVTLGAVDMLPCATPRARWGVPYYVRERMYVPNGLL